MSMSVIRKTDRKCVLCKHWNGAVGSTTIQPKLGGQFIYEHDEKQSCFKKCVPMPAWELVQTLNQDTNNERSF